MKNLWQTRILQSPEAEPQGGGGGGSPTQGSPNPGSLFTPSSGGGGAAAPQGNPNPAPAPSAGNAPAGNPSAGGAATGTPNTDWRSALPPELQEDATFKKLGSVSALAGAYLNAQKLIGADKIPLPGKHATDEDWRNVFTKLGLPETLDKYEVKFKEGVSIDEKFANAFRESAHKFGVLPKQAQALADWFSEVNLNSEKTIQTEMATRAQTEINGLKNEWGQAFDSKVARINKLLDQHGGEPLKKELEMRGLGANSTFMKALAQVADKLYKEDKLVGEEGGTPPLTPAEARDEANKIIGDNNHPYNLKDHPGHKAAVQEVANLFAMTTPKKN